MPIRLNIYKHFTGAWIPNWLLKRREISHGAKITYARLAQFAGEDGRAYPKISTLAEEIGAGETQTKAYIKELITNNLIEVVNHSKESLPNDYFFLQHEWMGFDVAPSRDSDPPPVARPTSSRESVNKKEIYKEKSSLEFDLFWQKYPRHVGKGAARKAWLKINPGFDLAKKILDAVDIQIEFNHFSKDEKFIPHPSTWLNNERWDDEIQREFAEFIR